MLRFDVHLWRNHKSTEESDSTEEDAKQQWDVIAPMEAIILSSPSAISTSLIISRLGWFCAAALAAVLK